MTAEEAIFYLEAILDDTLDHNDESDTKRIEAVELALEILEKHPMVEQGVSAAPPAMQPAPDNLVCPECGSAEVECLDWVRVNDNHVIGGNESMPADDYWCPICEIHEKPVEARDYCEEKGHTGTPCTVCGA